MWNDKETDIDLLGHEKIAQTIIEIVDDKHLWPLTIGVYGDWGVGKSSIIALLQRNIAEKNKTENLKAHCIIFNGWLFQGYEDAKTALMETVISELAALQPTHKKIQKLASSLIKRVNWLKVAKVSAGALISSLSGIPVGGLLGGVGEITKKMKELVEPKKKEDGSNLTVETKEEESFLKDELEQTVTSQIHSFRKEFAELIKTSKVDQVIVLVDDLDRCLPKSVIEILEAIRLFLFVEGTTFVISADEKMIEYSVREHFPNLPTSYSEYTRNYLEKLIQIPIRIPTLNRLQTGNYIRFLFLQNHLKHNYTELKRIYQLFESKKKTPYDNIVLSYEMIAEAFGSHPLTLKETLLISDQLTPTLATGLKGNPRNIKRFLNTLFLRIRIAKIYGLQDIIKLNMLAKLMLLERFQADKFDVLVNEISLSVDGISKSVQIVADKIAEEHKKVDVAKGNEQFSTIEEEKKDFRFKEWVSLEPSLSLLDLRPYIFISKEKAIAFDIDEALPKDLQDLLALLRSGSSISLISAGKKVAGITIEEASLLFDKLETESRAVTDLKNMPPSINGLLEIVKTHTSLEKNLINLMESFPPAQLGVWAASQLTGIKKETDAWKRMFKAWAGQDENKQLKNLAAQLLKK